MKPSEHWSSVRIRDKERQAYDLLTFLNGEYIPNANKKSLVATL